MNRIAYSMIVACKFSSLIFFNKIGVQMAIASVSGKFATSARTVLLRTTRTKWTVQHLVTSRMVSANGKMRNLWIIMTGFVTKARPHHYPLDHLLTTQPTRQRVSREFTKQSDGFLGMIQGHWFPSSAYCSSDVKQLVHIRRASVESLSALRSSSWVHPYFRLNGHQGVL